MTFSSFLLGLAVVAFGVAMVFKTEFFFSFTGQIAWAEERFGGTRFFLKVLGAVVCFFGVLTAFGLFRGFFLGTAGQLLLPPNAR